MQILKTPQILPFPIITKKKMGAKVVNRITTYEHTAGGIKYWRVRIGSRITKGAPIEKNFRSKVEADTFVKQKLVQLENQGTAAFSLSDSQRVEATQCYEKLEKLNVSLKTVVEYYIKHALPEGGISDFQIGSHAFIASRERGRMNCKPKYIVNLKSQFRILGEIFNQKKINEIKKSDLENWLANRAEALSWAPKTRNNFIITLRALWNYFVDQKWCMENIATKIDKSILDDIPIGIFTPEQAQKLLEVSQICWSGEMLAAISIGLFTGIRRSELCAIDWGKHVKENHIEISADISKTRKRRIVDISPNLSVWLSPLRRKEGRVFLGSEDRFDEKRKHLSKEAGLQWPRNAMRHSAASYHLAAFQNENLTALQMGHTVDMLHSHYKEVVTRNEALKYWAIVPLLKIKK